MSKTIYPHAVAKLISFFIVGIKNKKRFLEKHDRKCQKKTMNDRRQKVSISARDIIRQKVGHNFNPLHLIYVNRDKHEKPYFNLVTDSISSGSLFGGVGTAIILSIIFCNAKNARLRIVTRDEPGKISSLMGLSKFFDIKIPKDISFTFDDGSDKNSRIEYCDGDYFLATSWWSAKAIRGALPHKKIFYIIQEIETFFYPRGDAYFLADQMMKDKNILYIVNHSFLNAYFEKYQMISGDKIAFEPAFSKHLYNKSLMSCSSKKRKIFFYCRPNNPRNLFSVGLNLLDEAVRLGIIDTDKWDIYIAGSKNQFSFSLSNGYMLIDKGIMSLESYKDFLSEMDLTISLMYTPHPSYPPFDALLSGSVVLTNEFETKSTFACSKNIIVSKLEPSELMSNLKRAVDLALDIEQRTLNYRNQTICTDWENNLANVVDVMAGYYD